MPIIKAGSYKFKNEPQITNSFTLLVDFTDLSLIRNYGFRVTYDASDGVFQISAYRTPSLSQTIMIYGWDNGAIEWYNDNSKIIFIPNSVSVDDSVYDWFVNSLLPYTENIPTKTNTVSYRGSRVTIINGEITHNGEKYTTVTLPTKDKQLTQDIVITTTITN